VNRSGRGQPRIRWDDEMIRVLREMRAEGVNLARCAKRIGVAYSVVRYKARELGVGERIRSGPAPSVRP
jgi:hypothetical protein